MCNDEKKFLKRPILSVAIYIFAIGLFAVNDNLRDPTYTC